MAELRQRDVRWVYVGRKSGLAGRRLDFDHSPVRFKPFFLTCLGLFCTHERAIGGPGKLLCELSG
jgi:hypothetical protein